ncbi:hypothetical protein [Halorubrum ezzemoulense]|uniref:hypothetical protein n=1 Tax=Halorubrum ezzemoulense TaxID=337243 RepID=UPI0015C58DC1|nr:hypothetical protein [Halorubrum ezzemoulense]
MPTLNKRQSEAEGDQSEWFVVISGTDHPFTFQLEPEGYKWLLSARLNHKSEFDWEVFDTLRSLNMLYTLDSEYSPVDTPMPDDLSFEELSDKKRGHLTEGLLDRYSAAQLASKKETLQFLLSIGDLEQEYLLSILDRILSGTPFISSVIFDYTEAFNKSMVDFDDSFSDYNTVLLALTLSVVYDEIEPMGNVESINEGNPIWTSDGWIFCAGTELIFHAVKDVIVESLPDLLQEEIIKSVRSNGHGQDIYSFLLKGFSSISEIQFIAYIQDLNPHLAEIVAQGLKTGYPYSILILPRSITGKNSPFESSTDSVI